MVEIVAWKNAVCMEAKHHLLKNKEVKVLSCLLLFDLTPHVYSSAEDDDSLVKLCLSDDNSQTGSRNTECQHFETKT